jgi:predicted CXXCH cytochrome family protein
MNSRVRLSGLALVVALASALPAGAGIERTRHNLTAAGSGRFRGGPQANLCTFCHTPHNAKATRALWNHELPAQTYTLYESSTLEAQLQQPTGSSRLCLSCHDGTIALGALVEHPEPSLGPLTGPAVLGTDLSDDHPISFVYDRVLASHRQGLADPSTLVGAVKIDETGQMQCTSCHDPHSDRYPNFLVTDVEYSRLCVTCHGLQFWQDSAHATSSAMTKGAGPLPGWGFPKVAENGCASCHRTHNAEHPVRLLRSTTEEGVCLGCHSTGAASGLVAEKDIGAEFLKPSTHPIAAYTDVHDPAENPLAMPVHVECVDCHNPHQTRRRSVTGILAGPLTGVSGVDITGGVRPQASFEYEVCLKCHAVAQSPSPVVFRVDDITNVRLKIDPANPSFHPIAAAGKNPLIHGLLPGMTAASIIMCTSCHNNNAAPGGGTLVPRGPHGSIYAPILQREYRLEGTSSPESFDLYALCYNCHDRTVLFQSPSYPTPPLDSGGVHIKHVQEQGASCAVCHDAHGSRSNLHLINFMTSDRSGNQVVTASSAGPIKYQSPGVGSGSGSCTLTCHGSDHNLRGYGAVALSAGRKSAVLQNSAPTSAVPRPGGHAGH